MHKNCCIYRFLKPIKRVPYPLILSYLAGLLVGIILVNKQLTAIQIPFDILFRKPSVIILTPIVIFSVLLLSRYLSLCYPLVFVWSVIHGACGMLLNLAIGNSAWLFRYLLMFSSDIVTVCVIWLLLRHHKGVQPSFKKDIAVVTLISIFGFIFDALVIAPFLSELIIYI